MLNRILAVTIVLFSGCIENTEQKVPAGTIDTAAIAADTAMQIGIESSYEYHKSITVYDTLVYDVVGYGGPASLGEFAVMRRGADNKSDTIAKEKREGIIRGATLKDNQIQITVQKPGDSIVTKTYFYKIR